MTQLLAGFCRPAAGSTSSQWFTRSLGRLILLTSLVLTASACGLGTRPTINEIPTLVPTPQLANKYLAEGDTAQAANVFAQLAQSETDPQKRNGYLLTATELYFDTELYNEGMRLFSTFPATLNAP